ncbi:DUF6426 family protein [Streptomyces goshikiensis]|uniref:DUF6426 family protein n=1 Tax=Streptomyces goshikiensis TaxID=1942 RepID=UPI0033A2E3E7
MRGRAAGKTAIPSAHHPDLGEPVKLRSIATTAVLGAVVFTAVPAVAVPFSAYACGGSTLCQDEDPGDEGGGDDGGGNWGGGDWGGEGGGGEGGGGEGGDGGGDWSNDPGDPGNAPSDPGGSGVEIVDGPIGQPIDATLPEVVVTGHATRPSAPANPGIPTTHGGGVSGPGPLVTVHSRGRVWEERGKCYRNQSSSVEAKYSKGVTYTGRHPDQHQHLGDGAPVAHRPDRYAAQHHRDRDLQHRAHAQAG